MARPSYGKMVRIIRSAIFPFLCAGMVFISMSRCGGGGGAGSLPWNAYSITFDGVGYAQLVPFRTLMDLGITTDLETMTVSFWVKYATLPGTAQAPILGATTDGGWEDGFVFWTGENLTDIGEGSGINKLRFAPNDFNSQEAGILISDLSADTWYHVVGVYNENGQVANGQNVKIFLNGVLKEQIGLTVNFENFREPTAGQGHLQFGSSNSGVRFSGQLDEVAIWKDNLSAAEVLALYNSGTPFRPTGEQGAYSSASDLRGYWDMGDGDSFPTLSDRTGNGYTGTLTNLGSGSITADSPGGS